MPSWSYVEPFWGHVGQSWRQVGPMLGHLGASLGLSWAILGPSWAYVGPMLGPLGAMLGLCWAILGLILCHLGAMLGQGGTPRKFSVTSMLLTSKRTKHRKLQGLGGTRSAAGAGSRIAKATALAGRGLCPSTGPAGPI